MNLSALNRFMACISGFYTFIQIDVERNGKVKILMSIISMKRLLISNKVTSADRYRWSIFGFQFNLNSIFSPFTEKPEVTNTKKCVKRKEYAAFRATMSHNMNHIDFINKTLFIALFSTENLKLSTFPHFL